jgi:hypothetical protein
MTAQYTRADCLREYLTGANSDGEFQPTGSLSLGGYRSLVEVASLGIVVENALRGVAVLYASGSNPQGPGRIISQDSSLAWQPYGASAPGPFVQYPPTETVLVLESGNAAQFLRVRGTSPIQSGGMGVTLYYLPNNLYGFDNVPSQDALAGVTHYRAGILRNESTNTITSFRRCISKLGTPQVSSSSQLGGSGSGTIGTGGSYQTWPAAGWVQVRSSGGTLKEVVYYTSRTGTVLTVPASGRGLLGTTPTVGSSTDIITPTPGVSVGVDSAGVVAFGTPIQTVASQTIPPTGVVWNLGIIPDTGLEVPVMEPNTQVGLWIKREIPSGCVASPQTVVQLLDSFNSV